MLNLDNLNKEQKEAVVYDGGPLAIIAGAGTGKTTVITLRIAYLIEKNKAKPEEILGLTFTDEAAGQMEERIDRILPFSYSDILISTFHSFAKTILEENAFDIGLSPDFKVIDQVSSWFFVRENLDKFKLDYYKPLANPTRFIYALTSHFLRCKDYGIFPQDYLNFAKNLKNQEKEKIKEVALAYQTYQNLLLENNLLDFGDLLNFALKLFQKRPAILKNYQKKFKYILVDEFQDTNWVQYQLLKLLAPPQNNITVCFDDDQAIYRWRGASYNNILQFRKDFPKVKEIVLLKNYRSYQNILDFAYRFVQNNNPYRLEYISGIKKKLKSTKKGRGVIEYKRFKNLSDQAIGIMEEISKILKKNRKVNLGDFAILTRTNEEASYFANFFENKGISCQFLAWRGLYLKPIVLDIISFFKLLDNYHENNALFRVLNWNVFEIPYEETIKITTYAKRKTISIYQALQQKELLKELSPKTVSKILFLLNLIKKYTSLALRSPLSEIFVKILEETGFLKYLAKKQNYQEASFLTQFYKKIQDFENSSFEPTLKNFLEKINIEIESGQAGKLDFFVSEDKESLKIMTVHSAKGLEFEYVFLPNLVDKRFPTVERKDPIEIPKPLIKEIISAGNPHLEEERRLFYVGLTRAKKGIFLSSVENFQTERRRKPSRFLKELGLEKKEPQEAKSIFFKKPITSFDKIKKTAKERKFLPPYFSFSQLEAFRNCPLQYKFAHIIQIPIRGNASFSYGKTMHNTLYQFTKNIGQKKLGWGELLKIYKTEWIDEWYESDQQKEKYFRLGKEALKKFYKKFLKEKPEILKIDGQRAVEVPFKLKIKNEILIGRIDRIDKIKGGVELIDYKTGKSKKDLTSDERQQLLIYQMAAQEVFGFEVKNLTYYYLDDAKKVSFLGTKEVLQKEKEKILKEIEKIKKSDFSPTPGWQCRFCDFKDFCSYAIIVNY